MPAIVSAPARTRTIALVGNPNSGKTTLFNALTGLRQKVGNYPGVTAERKEGTLARPGGGGARGGPARAGLRWRGGRAAWGGRPVGGCCGVWVVARAGAAVPGGGGGGGRGVGGGG